jgi:predicted DNA-binding protein (MmcQ/YjbR family)
MAAGAPPNKGVALDRAGITVFRDMTFLAADPASERSRSAKRRSKTMATLEKALDKMREICLSLPDTREGDHFGETAFYVRGKLFATCGAKHGVCEITFGLEPDHAAALVENDPRFKPYSRDKRGVVLDAAKVKRWSEVQELILESYELVKPPKVKKAAKKSTPGKGTRW